MYNNNYTVFPSSPEDGDSFEFRGRTYIYKKTGDVWTDSTITNIFDGSDYVVDYRNPSVSMNTKIISRRADIEADAKYNLLCEQKRNKLHEADFYITNYQELNQSVTDIVNYKVSIEAIDNNLDPADVSWPTPPWN